MNTYLVIFLSLIWCTAPLWAFAVGYVVAMRGWRIRLPIARVEGEEESYAAD